MKTFHLNPIAFVHFQPTNATPELVETIVGNGVFGVEAGNVRIR